MAENREEVKEPANTEETAPSAIEFRLVDKVETVRLKNITGH